MKKIVLLLPITLLFSFQITQARNTPKKQIVYKLLREGSLLAGNQKYREALAKFQQAEKILPNFGITLYLLGKCYNSMKEYKKGLDYLRRSEKTGKFPPDLYISMAISYARLQEWDKAGDYTKIFLAKEKNPELLRAGKMMLRRVNEQIERRDKAQAEQNSGIKAYQNKNYKSALLHFQRASKIATKNGHLHYLMGLCLNGLRKYKQALLHFRKSKSLGYTPADLTLQIGIAKANLGKYREAKGEFNTYAKDKNSPKKQIARQYARKIQDYEDKNKPLQLHALFGFIYDSNVLSAGSAVQLPTTISNKGDFNLFLGGGGEYRFLGEPKHYLSLKGDYFSTYQIELEDFSLQNLKGSLKGGYLLRKNLFSSFEIGYNYLFVGGDSYQSQLFTTSSLTYQIRPWTAFGFNYQYIYQVDFITRISREINRTGNIHALGLIEYFSFADLGLKCQLSYHYGETHSIGSDYDYNSHTLALWLSKDLPYKMNVTVGIQYDYRNFLQPNFRAGSLFTRQESFWMYSLYWKKKWALEISSFISYSFLDSKSNLGIYRYQKHRVMFGVRWDG